MLGIVISPSTMVLFSIGDGVYFLNGKFSRIGPFPNNAPPYLGYSLLKYVPDEWINLQVHATMPTKEISSLLIGSDGLENLILAAENNIPGKNEKVGPINQFWEDDRYFKNPDMIRRRLTLVNRTITKTDWDNRKILKEHGLLPDDTTLIVIRRKK